jgi:hypothetical protein
VIVRVAPELAGVSVIPLPATSAASVCARDAELKSLMVLAACVPVWFALALSLA